MRTLIQVPEGLRRTALEIADKADDTIICAEPCYGGCDLRDREAAALGCEKIIHVGHTKFCDSGVHVEYMENKMPVDAVRPLMNAIEKLNDYKSVALVASLQFTDSISQVKPALESAGKRVFIGQAMGLQPGQILGCAIGAAKEVEKEVDCFLVVGSGKFHALGLAMATDKPVFTLDVERGRIEDVKELKEKILKQKFAAVALAKGAQRFGILISTKPGQTNIRLAEQLKNKLTAAGKRAWLLAMDEITPAKLAGFGLDAYICTACPRIAIENRTLFDRPILNPDEAEEIFK